MRIIFNVTVKINSCFKNLAEVLIVEYNNWKIQVTL